MSSFINIKGNLLNVDCFGQIQPKKVKLKDDNEEYLLLFYDKNLQHRNTFKFESTEDLVNAVISINTVVGIKIEEDVEKWL